MNIHQIIKSVSRVTGVAEELLFTISRKAVIVQARDIVFYVAHKHLTGCKRVPHASGRPEMVEFKAVCEMFERSHESVLTRVAHAESKLANNLTFRELVGEVMSDLGVSITLPETEPEAEEKKPRFKKKRNVSTGYTPKPKEPEFSWRAKPAPKFTVKPVFGRV